MYETRKLFSPISENNLKNNWKYRYIALLQLQNKNGLFKFCVQKIITDVEVACSTHYVLLKRKHLS